MAGGTGHRLDGLKARRILGGVDLSILAHAANVSDLTIKQLENGGNCTPEVSSRILAALIPAQALTSQTAANPCVVTKAGHGFQTGDVITITGQTGSTPTINSTYTVTRINTSTFSIPEDTSGGSAGTGGTATATLASLSQAAL